MPQLESQAPRRQVVVAAGAFLAIAATSFAGATFEYMAVPIQSEFGLSADQTNATVLVRVTASLLVVFVAGALADQIGRRKVALLGAAAYCSGALLVALCWGMPSLMAGQAVGGVGALVLSVIGLAAVDSTFRDRAQRARVFAAYGALAPAVFLVAPLVAAKVSTHLGWRWVPLMWFVFGATSGLVLLRTVTGDSNAKSESRRPEILTPLMAGFVLVGIAVSVIAWADGSRFAAVAAIFAMLSTLALVVLRRARPGASLDLRVLRRPGALLVVSALLLAAVPNMFFYTNLLMQYRNALPLPTIALLMVIPQAAAVVGAFLSGPVIRKFGAPHAAFVMLGLASLTSLGAFAVRANSPAWFPILVLAVCALPIGGAVGPLTEALMDLAPTDGSEAAASVRNATWSLGGVVGGAIVAGAGFAAFQASLADRLATTSLTAEQAQAIAAEVRGGAAVQYLAQSPQVSDPLAQQLLTGKGLWAAQAQAYWLVGVLSAAAYLAAAILLAVYIRRRGAR